MKLYELLTENKKQVDEAPMGSLSGLANKAMAKIGSAKAAGKVDTGTIANQLHKEFETYLGRTGREATKDAVLGFLKSKGYPTQGAATIINQAVNASGSAPTGPLANIKQGAANAVSAAKAGISNAVDKVKSKLEPAATAEPEKVEPTGDAEPTKPSYGGNAYGKTTYSMGTGFDKATMKNTSKELEPGTVGTPPKKKKVAVSASKEVDSSRAISEAAVALPKDVIDKAILKAAQDAAIVKGKPAATAPASTSAAPVSAKTPSSSGSFTKGLKKGLTGKTPATTSSDTDLAGLEQRIAAIEKKVGLA